MSSTRLAVIAAAAAVAAWAAKAVAIGLAGGLDKSPAEGPLFLLGLLCSLIAVGALAVSAARRGRWWTRAAAVVGALVVMLLVVAVTSSTIEAVAVSDHWVWSELNLWIVSLAVLGVVLLHSSRRSPSYA